jgi:hypothetical protein
VKRSWAALCVSHALHCPSIALILAALRQAGPARSLDRPAAGNQIGNRDGP